MMCKYAGIYGFLGLSQVLITLAPRDTRNTTLLPGIQSTIPNYFEVYSFLYLLLTDFSLLLHSSCPFLFPGAILSQLRPLKITECPPHKRPAFYSSSTPGILVYRGQQTDFCSNDDEFGQSDGSRRFFCPTAVGEIQKMNARYNFVVTICWGK